MGTIEALRTERDAHQAALDAGKVALRDAQKRWDGLRLSGENRELAALDKSMSTLTRTVERHSQRVQSLDAEIGDAERAARILRAKIGEKLLPFLVELVTLTPEAAAAVEPLLNEYNQLVGEG